MDKNVVIEHAQKQYREFAAQFKNQIVC